MKTRKLLIPILMVALLFIGCASTKQPEEIVEADNKPADIAEESVDNNTVEAPAEDETEEEVQSVPEDERVVPEVLPIVYMTTDISPEGLRAAYDALERVPESNVAVKLSTGEGGNNHYLSPDLIKDLVQSVNGTIVECNTSYSGFRMDTAMHMQVAEEHGFTAIADVDIMDRDGYISLPVTGGRNLTENLVGATFNNYDFYLVLSHFKGHTMAGFGGAIKNISIGLASREGKNQIHSAGATTLYFSQEFTESFLESIAEAALSVSDYLDDGERIMYINVMNHLSIDCDCDGSPAKPDMADIGILASLDPVALDQACIDLVYAAEDGASLVTRIESRNGLHTLKHAEAMGLGYRTYELVSLDD